MLLKIKLKSLEGSLLKNYIKILKKKDKEIKIIGLPKKTVRFTILASPHVNIRAREHYELKINNLTIYTQAAHFILPPAGIAYKLVFIKKFI